MLRREMAMLMLMIGRFWGGEVAERRGVLMEIRGKHGCCVLASVSSTIPPLDGRGRGQISMPAGDGW